MHKMKFPDMASEWEDFEAGIGSNHHSNVSENDYNSRFQRGGRRGGFEARGVARKIFNDSHISNGTGGRDADSESGSFNSRSVRSGKGGPGGGVSREVDEGIEMEFKEEKNKEFYIPPEPSTDEHEIFGGGITSGINFNKYDQIPIRVTGDKCPDPIMSFANSGLSELLMSNIEKCGYTEPTPIQKTAIPVILSHRDLMGCAQTGSGKTAAFILPILHTLLTTERDLAVGRPHVVIISPTRELTTQLYNEVHKFGHRSFLKFAIAYGGTATRHQSANINKGCHVLVATPGRLLDFVSKGYITFEDVRFVVLDEADRMLDMGFMPAIEEVLNHRSMPPMHNRQTLMFSATFPSEIQVAAGKFLRDYIFIAVGIVGGACTDVEQIIHEVQKYDKRDKLVEILDEHDPSGTMVFVETKRDADFLASFLSETTHPTTSIHGDREQRQREEALFDFKCGRMKILIATSVAARGLDIKNVNHVINYNLPKHIDDYVHRIGRTGRLGNRGKATSFFDPELDLPIAADLKKILEQAQQTVPDFLAKCSGGTYGRQNFGGRDVRRSNKGGITVQEAQEEW